ncbi:putative UTP--glucose-1-phosphate uridylyltransferase [Rozella allomycis CSF55]|uniref:UTP--glucose-1-phosphate uridylyltransferase n=1 Tax=Rozella allomycis (strain CSF55) TaxID=988480 RepID=A0A075B4T3_ROZAC|nr:UTP--glucose-1-phosphate uridylyltransferase domain-containing protein [Rozella allomycis CSF55]RKP21230.1 putative UTP--glucose-1-phosphate uridylyltransferase [Rozella allomycis CSF55]|eukprot:EPZ36469.1 UTP--glucose-1-phosphate uridylyltransferase domain-containing protein [Rozella allomycis CSF55]
MLESPVYQYFSKQHSRSMSICKFDQESSSASAKAMKNELKKLVEQVQDPEKRKAFEREMSNFNSLFLRFMAEKSKKLSWDKIKCPDADQIVHYSKIEKVNELPQDILKKLCVLKLNGGLGTTMGCTGPKSAIEVREGMTFLDLTVRQIEFLNQENGTNIPLILMNSFNTDEETKKIVQKYSSHNLQIVTFNQSRFPRIGKESLLPIPNDPLGKKNEWYPPGHGNVFEAMNDSGLLERLLQDGYEYIFISNIDNLGATVDFSILKHMIETKAEFIMEVTDKTKADIKGGTLIDYEGQVRLLEIAQVPQEHLTDFTSIKKFKIFNTNNIWVSLKAIQRVVNNDELGMEVIVNHKRIEETDEKVIQLETAVGAAIKHFSGAHGVNVPRSRFLPVKSCSDLFLVQSDLYSLSHGALTINPKRLFATVPLVKLGDHFKKVQNYLSRFSGPPHILELDHLTVTGDVSFGKNVVLKGTVIIVANHGCRIDIPSGSILEDKVVSGNLHILDH